MGGKVAVILAILMVLSLSGCFPKIVERGTHSPVGFLQNHTYGLDFYYQAYEIVSWEGRECMFVHVWADEGNYRESLLDCED